MTQTTCGLASAHQSIPTPIAFRAQAFPLFWRIVAGALVAVSRASLPVVLVLGLLAEGPIPLFAWLRALGALALTPALAAWLIRLARAVDIEVRCAELVVRRRGLRLEIPGAAISEVAPWAVPLPGAGFSLQTRSGRRFRYGLAGSDLMPLLSALADAAGVAAARAAVSHPSVIYAQAKGSGARWRWYHWGAKFFGFALLPTAVMSNLHQHVAYGGLLGQYYLEGLAPYLKTFSIYWGLITVYLILYASVWRGLAETATLVTAWTATAHAMQVRRVAERACQVLYYGGVPLMLLLPFLQ